MYGFSTNTVLLPILMQHNLKAKIFALGEWYGCRGLAVVANSGALTFAFKHRFLNLEGVLDHIHSYKYSLVSIVTPAKVDSGYTVKSTQQISSRCRELTRDDCDIQLQNLITSVETISNVLSPIRLFRVPNIHSTVHVCLMLHFEVNTAHNLEMLSYKR